MNQEECQKYQEITRNTYNSVSEHWDIKHRISWDIVKSFLKEQKNKEDLILLDVGCGTGRDMEAALKIGYSKENIKGCDFSEGQINIIKKKGFGAKVCSMINLDYTNESFDIVMCNAALHHNLKSKDQLKALQEIKRVMKKDAKAIIINWFPKSEFIEKNLKKGKFLFTNKKNKIVRVHYTVNSGGEVFDRYYYLFDEEEIKTLCEKVDFKIIKSQKDDKNLFLTLQK